MGDLLVKTLVVLVGIAALAFLVLYAGRRLGLGRPAGPMAVIGRLPLDHRRMLYLVRVGERVFVIGASEGGLNKLGELQDDELRFAANSAEATPEVPEGFAGVLRRARSELTSKQRTGHDEP